MKKRFTLMMMVLCFLMSIPLKMMAQTPSASTYDKITAQSHYKTGKWGDNSNFDFITNDGKIYTCVLKNVTEEKIYFRILKKSNNSEWGPESSSTTKDNLTLTSEYQQAYQYQGSNTSFLINATVGKTYTITWDNESNQIKYSEGGSEVITNKGIKLNASSPLTGSNGKYTLDLMRSAATDVTITLTIDGDNYGLATAQTIDAVGTTNVDFTKGKTAALTLTKGFIYSLTVTEDGKMTVVAKKGVADGYYYLVGNFFDDDKDINYDKKYFRFTNSKGDGTLTIDIPASLTIKAQIYTSDGSCYGPNEGKPHYGISNTNPKADATDKSVSGNLVAGDNYWTFSARGIHEIGIYTITITLDADGKPTKWNVAYDKTKRMVYFLVDPTEDPDAVVHPTYAVVKEDGKCDNKFFGNIYLEKGQHCFVVGNIKKTDKELNGTLSTTKKLYLQGNGGFDPTMEGNSDERDKYTHVYPNQTKGFIFNVTKSMVLEYNPSKGHDSFIINEIGGEILNAHNQISEDGDPITSVQIVGDGVVGSWYTKDAKEMTYNKKLDCWECTITTYKSESKNNKFRFIANREWKYNWGENSTDESEQARIPYTDENKPGHAASLKDPNELGFTKKGTEENRDGEGTHGDIIFNRPAGVWIIRLFTRTEDDGTGNDYVARHACTITESKEIYLTYCKDKFIRTYSNNKPMDPVNDNVKIYEVYKYKYENTEGGNADNIYAKGTVYLRQLKYVPANVGVVLIGEVPNDGKKYKDGDQLAFSLLERTDESVKPGGDYGEVWTKSEYYKAKGEKWNNYLVPTVEAKNNLGNAEADENGKITYRYFGLHNYYSTKRHQSLGKTDPNEDYIGFFRLTAKGRSGANKAYLSIPANAEVGNGVGATYGYIDYNGQLLGNKYEDPESMPAKYANMALVFDDMVDGNETTGIKELETEKMNNNKYYNLQGIEVAHPVKGIYIHNGKKVIVK